MKNRFILLVISFSFSLLSLRQASAGENEYLRAQDAVKSGDREFAFIYFLSELRDNPQSKRRQEALFAAAEYYFLVRDYGDAVHALEEFIEDYPCSELRIFTLFYLLKISQAWGRDDLAKNIEKQIINLRRVVLLFQETKEYKFKSPLGINHRLIYYIDKLQFYSDDKLQAQIYY